MCCNTAYCHPCSLLTILISSITIELLTSFDYSKMFPQTVLSLVNLIIQFEEGLSWQVAAIQLCIGGFNFLDLFLCPGHNTNPTETIRNM